MQDISYVIHSQSIDVMSMLMLLMQIEYAMIWQVLKMEGWEESLVCWRGEFLTNNQQQPMPIINRQRSNSQQINSQRFDSGRFISSQQIDRQRIDSQQIINRQQIINNCQIIQSTRQRINSRWIINISWHIKCRQTIYSQITKQLMNNEQPINSGEHDSIRTKSNSMIHDT